MASKLFEPVNIGSLRIPNRLAMMPMVNQFADELGYVTQRQIDYYIERAKNNVGLIIVEATCVARGARLALHQPYIFDDTYIPVLSKLAVAIKKAGACCFLQLHHAGRRSLSADNQGIQPVAPSALPMRNGEMPHELTVKEIEGVIEAFAQAALRAKQAGFDGVELQFAHGYLINQFLSPLTNKRSDKYGGDFMSRTRIALEVLQRVRALTGDGYPISCRFCGDEYVKGGITQRAAQRMAVLLQNAGINAINVTVGYTPSHEEGLINTLITLTPTPMSMPHGCFLTVAENIKKVVKVPVFAMGRLDDPELAEKVVAEGKADIVAIGRGFLSDPYFASKIYNKKYDDIRRCIACNFCITHMHDDINLRCTVNAELGRETEYRLKPAAKAKRVVVIGGGPGGMEAARVAALRGHNVVLFEKKPYLGGNMVPASAPSFKRDISSFTKYLSQAIDKLQCEIHLATEANPKRISAFNPDVVILATGSSPIMPAIPGIESRNVTHAVDVLERKVKTGKRVVVAGGGAIGCEAAAFLAESGKEVSIVEMRNTDFSAADGLAPDMDPVLRKWFQFELLPKLPIEVIGKSTFKEVTGKGLIVEDREGKSSLIAGDTIVFAAGMKSNNTLKEQLQGKVLEIYEIGDCVKPRHIIEAVEEAARVARLI